LNLIVLIVIHQFLLPQPKSRSIFAPPPKTVPAPMALTQELIVIRMYYALTESIKGTKR